jgi:hypothetical protein
MNEWLFQPQIKLGDFVILRDSLERLNPNFTKQLPEFINWLEINKINTVYQRSKLLMFRRWFNQQFVNGLHWGLVGAKYNYIAMEQLQGFEKDDESYAYSIRDKVRPHNHRYRHECYYLINYGANGNHLALFWKKPEELEYHQEEFARFLGILDERGIGRNVDTWGAYIHARALEKTLDDVMKHHINLERPLRNYYRYYVLGHTNDEILLDEDSWRIP